MMSEVMLAILNSFTSLRKNDDALWKLNVEKDILVKLLRFNVWSFCNIII